MKVLHVVNAWPDVEYPIRGIFIKEQIDVIGQFIENLDVLVIPRTRGIAKYALFAPVIRERARDFDIVHSHHVLTALSCIGAGIPTSKHIVSFLNGKGHNVLRVPRAVSLLLERIVAQHCAAAIYKNLSFANSLRPGDIVLPNAVDARQFCGIDRREACLRLGLNPARKRLIFVSANDLHRPSKRYDRFVEVVRICQGIDPSVEPICLVSTPRDQVPYVYAASDVLVVCSEHEGSPNAVKEALSTGLPVISTDVGDVSQQIENVSDCKIVSPFSASVMAFAIANAISSSVSREARRDQYLKGKREPEAVARAILNLYGRVHNS